MYSDRVQQDTSSFQLLLPSSASYAQPQQVEEQLPLRQQLMTWAQNARRPFWESGLWCASLACIIFSFSSLQVKLTGGRVPVLQLCIIRSSISFCTSIAVGYASGIKPLFGHNQHFHLLFLRGFFGTLAIASSYVALLNLPLGDAVTIAQMRPPVTAVMARLLLNEPLTSAGAVGCLISIAGVTVLAHPPFLFGGHSDWSRQRMLGTLSGVASTLFASGTGYAIRRIGKKEPALVVALWFHTTTISLMVWPLLLGIPQHAKTVARHDCLLLLGIAATSFFAQLLMTRSYQLIAAARAAAVSFTSVVYSHILGAVIFHEKLTLSTLSGGALIFIGVLLVTLHGGSSSSSGGGSSSAAAAAASKCADCSTAVQQQSGGTTTDNLSTATACTAVTENNESQQQQQQQQQLLGLRRPAWLQQLLGRDSRSSSSGGGNCAGSTSSRQQYQHLALDDTDCMSGDHLHKAAYVVEPAVCAVGAAQSCVDSDSVGATAHASTATLEAAAVAQQQDHYPNADVHSWELRNEMQRVHAVQTG